jgi:hypothetical protein
MTPAEQAALFAYQQEQQRAAAQNQQDQGGLLDTLGKLALGAGAAAAGVYGARRLLRGAGAVAPSKVAPSAAEVRRAAGAVPADVARQQRGIELTRLARAERPQGVVQTNLDQLVQAVLNDLPDEANKAAANQFLARGKERAGVTGALTKATPSPTEFLNEAVEQVAVKVLDQPGTAQLQGRTFQALPVGRATTEELAAGQRLLEDPELLSLVKQQTAEELSEARSYQSKAQAEYRNLLSSRADEALSAIRKETNTVQAAAQEDFANQYLRNQGYTAADTLVDQQQGRIVGQVDHFANAVNSAEDQTTGRVKAALQRNEDTNLAAIEMAEDAVDQQLARLTQQSPEAASSIDVDAAINQVASQLKDGLPVDQAEQMTSAARFMQRERAEIASQLGEQGLPLSPSRVEAELANRLSGSEAWKYGPKYTQRKQALQLGATYEPQFFENLKTPSVRIAGETVPTEMLKEPVAMAETAERLQEQVEAKRNWLGQVRLEEQKNKVRLMNIDKNINELENYKNEISSFLSSGKATSEQARIGSQRLSDVSLDLDRLDTYRNELMKDVYTGEKRIQGARAYTEEAIAGLQLPQKLKSGIEEGQRVFFETDVTGQIIPETMELRSERPMITTDPKGGAGRNLAEYTVPERIDEEIRVIQGGGRIRDYDPETGAPVQRWQPNTADIGREIDIYGIRPSSEFRADPEMRPTKTYPSKTPLTQEATPERLTSVELSEQVRKSADPQAFLQEEMKKRGISAIGQASPWPRRNR